MVYSTESFHRSTFRIILKIIKIEEMKNYLIIFALFIMPPLSQAQDEQAAVIKVIESLFDGMRASDSLVVKSAFLGNITMKSVFEDNEGTPQMKEVNVAAFAKAVGTPHDQLWDEKIWSYEVQIDGLLASVWTDYTFYLGDKLSHCGVNNFQLQNTRNGWKIIQLVDTRRKINCKESPKSELNTLLDNWHKAAGTADEDAFFGSIGKNGIYIGTDKTERWEKSVFEVWSKEYFDKESAWDFTPIEREIYLSKDYKVAWFNETLDTWMGVCRGSGVLEKEDGEWKIQHYHLSVTIDNDLIKGFMKLTGVEK